MATNVGRLSTIQAGLTSSATTLSNVGSTAANTSILLNTLGEESQSTAGQIATLSTAALGLAAVFGGPLGGAVATFGTGIFALASQFGLLTTQVDENEVRLQSYRGELIRTGLDAITASERITALRGRNRETGISLDTAINTDRIVPRDRLFGDDVEQEVDNLSALLEQAGVDGVAASNAIRAAFEGDFAEINRILFEVSGETLGNIQSFEEIRTQIGQLYLSIAANDEDSLIGAFKRLRNEEIDFADFQKFFVQELIEDSDELSEELQLGLSAIVAGLEDLDAAERDSLLLALQNTEARLQANGDSVSYTHLTLPTKRIV